MLRGPVTITESNSSCQPRFRSHFGLSKFQVKSILFGLSTRGSRTALLAATVEELERAITVLSVPPSLDELRCREGKWQTVLREACRSELQIVPVIRCGGRQLPLPLEGLAECYTALRAERLGYKKSLEWFVLCDQQPARARSNELEMCPNSDPALPGRVFTYIELMFYVC